MVRLIEVKFTISKGTVNLIGVRLTEGGRLIEGRLIEVWLYQYVDYSIWVQMDFNTAVLFRRPTNVGPLIS